jgi:hypothetical protein
MDKYRLKKEAVPFFRRELTYAVLSWDTWTKTYNVDPSALEEVEDCFVSYGFETKTGTSLCGWGNPDSNNEKTKKGAHFHFTIHFPSMKNQEYDLFSKGKLSRDLMDRIQNVLNQFYSEFNEVMDNK